MTSAPQDSVERYCPSCERSYAENESRCPADGTLLVRLASAGPDPLVGNDLDGRFLLKERLGAGAMGAVYRAVQLSVGREVAVKIVMPQLVSDPLIAKRFLREAKLGSRLSHPNIVQLVDFGQTSAGLFFIAMELLVGHTLKDVLARDGSFPVPRLLRVGQQLCDALHAAHRMKIVHRDLKPSNIIVLDEPPGRDHVKVLDFGVAKSLSVDTTTTTITGSGNLLGTPRYMAPEAARGRDTDARSDLYSLGVILYELAAGRPPFDGDTVNTVLMEHLHEPPPPLPSWVPKPVEQVILRLLEKDPDHRYFAAVTVEVALTNAVTAAYELEQLEALRPSLSEPGARAPAPRPEGSSVVAGAATVAPRPRRWVGGAVGAAVLLAAVVAALLLRGPPEPAAVNAVAAAPVAGAIADAAPLVVVALPDAAVPVAAAAAPVAADVEVTLRATPRAEVWVAGRRAGETPFVLTLRGGAPEAVTFRRKGHVNERRRIDGSTRDVEVKLVRARAQEGLPF